MHYFFLKRLILQVRFSFLNANSKVVDNIVLAHVASFGVIDFLRERGAVAVFFSMENASFYSAGKGTVRIFLCGGAVLADDHVEMAVVVVTIQIAFRCFFAVMALSDDFTISAKIHHHAIIKGVERT